MSRSLRPRRPPMEERRWVEAQRYRGPLPLSAREEARLERDAETRLRAEVTAAGFTVAYVEQEWRRRVVLITTAVGRRPAT